jgi:hypothetical protein
VNSVDSNDGVRQLSRTFMVLKSIEPVLNSPVPLRVVFLPLLSFGDQIAATVLTELNPEVKQQSKQRQVRWIKRVHKGCVKHQA